MWKLDNWLFIFGINHFLHWVACATEPYQFCNTQVKWCVLFSWHGASLFFPISICRHNSEARRSPKNLRDDSDVHLKDQEATVLIFHYLKLKMKLYSIFLHYISFTCRNFIPEPEHRKRRSNFFVGKSLLPVWRYVNSQNSFFSFALL